MDKRPQLLAKNKTKLMSNNASCKRWDTPVDAVTMQGFSYLS